MPSWSHKKRSRDIFIPKELRKVWRTCPCGKLCYDKKAAQSARNKRWKDDRVKLRIYQCPRSNAWHLTSKKKYGM